MRNKIRRIAEALAPLIAMTVEVVRPLVISARTTLQRVARRHR